MWTGLTLPAEAGGEGDLGMEKETALRFLVAAS